MEHPLKYDELIIYYFSGTGNALNASKWIGNIAAEKGLRSQIVNIDSLEKIDFPQLTSKTLIGFCSPTHGFNLPPLVLRFIWNFPKTKKTDAFILNTRGGMKMHKLFLPGLSGIAQIFPALILIIKGFRIVGMQPLDLPSNWLILHPGLTKQVVNSIYIRCKIIVDEFALKMLSGKINYKALLSFPIDLALLPVSVGYYFVGRFFLAKTLISTSACNACEKCVVKCPVNAITMVDERPFWSYNCESCMRCVSACNQRAIETTHTFSSVLIIVSSLVISPLLIALLQYSGVWEFIKRSALAGSIWSLINAFIFLMFVFISYRMLHYLMRYKTVNNIIKYSSLSTYKFWRRYKAPKNYKLRRQAFPRSI